MDDLTTRALRNQNNANANYNSKQQREEQQKALTEAPAFITGFADGKYQVQRLGQDPVTVGVPVTNGLLQTGQRVTMTGQYVDGMPRVKPVVPVGPVVPADNIKYLFTTTDSEFTYLYVGGWQPQAVLVTKVPTGQFFAASKLDNLGGNRYQVSLAIADGVGTQLIFATTGYQVGALFKTLAGSVRPVGAGFWVTTSTSPFIPNYLGSIYVDGYYSYVTDETGNPDLNNKVDSFYLDQVLATAFSRMTDNSTGQSSFSGSPYVLPTLQVSQTLNDIGVFRDFYNVKRVDPKGQSGYLLHYDTGFDTVPSWVSQDGGVVQHPTKAAVLSAIDNSYMDVSTNKFSLIKKTDIDIFNSKAVAVDRYDSAFNKQSSKSKKVFKQTISASATLLDVSYGAF